mmetsp:Transcript_19138/g.35781  ORF Transcript_19138/g.35781 Transcript_19138/m.35781 type:complete len:196 (+) Transcript_19138:156-743(+)|eukprot:CAMPEP_0201670430 /NCGR_PEP_ID=MMETSP0494-20130426/26748_1 /ASSEMBLY_ACC=CAM_ASM_000839 /TAXON_ID=420259 /ORGANISM="Thalassiosira gravida, Strain GMp14c1" /LENGTH=195 /DNA_ID=CAMNT_0048151487 /DNA_START=160 /DNA_END=747 /DNA_ORIENTATION=+
MADNNAAIIEEELPHEIYANLIEKHASFRQSATVRCRSHGDRTNTAAVAASSHSNYNGNGSRGNNSRGAPLTVIPTDKCCPDPEPSSSQFIKFYRKSCQTQQHSNFDRGSVGHKRAHSAAETEAASSSAHKPKETKNSKNIRSQRKTQSTTTKSERKSMAKRERERQVKKDKRIRMMFRSDFSEVDEMLYRSLTR